MRALKFGLVIFVPGLLFATALVKAWRYVFVHEDRLSDAWLKDFRIADGADTFEREMDESRVVLPRTVASGPPTRALSKVGIR